LERERDKWEQKLYNLDIDLTTVKDRVYLEQMTQQQAIQDQVDEMKCALAIVQNYADSLEFGRDK
jgi:hypothetical protein